MNMLNVTLWGINFSTSLSKPLHFWLIALTKNRVLIFISLGIYDYANESLILGRYSAIFHLGWNLVERGKAQISMRLPLTKGRIGEYKF